MTDIICPVQSAVEKYKNETALVSSDKKITYEELNMLINKTEEWLTENKVKKNDRVAILSENRIEVPILLMSLFRIGATACFLNIRLPEKSLITLMNQISVSHLFYSENLPMSGEYMNITTKSLKGFFDTLKSYQYNYNTARLSLEQTATIIFTSGSIGDPKGVLHSFGNHYFSAIGSNENIKLIPGDRWLVSLPLYHVGGLGILFRTFLSGATVVIPDSNENLEEAIIRYNISHCSLVPTQLYRLLQSESINEISRNLKALLIGGGKIPLKLIKKAIDADLPIHTTYGLTEMASQVTATPSDSDLNLLKTSGMVLKHREMKISEESEIVVKGKTLFQGYIAYPNDNNYLDKDGWFHTGDIGNIDSDGFLTVFGRKDNMFISGGENIYPEKIESTLMLADKIEDAIVVGIKDPEYGERPVAFIKSSVNPNYNTVSESLRKVLPGYMIPIAFYELPDDNKSGVIKYNRLKLKKLAEKLYYSTKQSS